MEILKDSKYWTYLSLAYLFVYGVMLLIQAFAANFWPTDHIHRIAMFGGGISLLVWALSYYFRGPAVVVIRIIITVTLVAFTVVGLILAFNSIL